MKKATATTSKPLREADIVSACVDFLLLDYWRPIKMEPVSNRAWGKGTGEIGQPDYLFLRYTPTVVVVPPKVMAQADVLWVEFKRPKDGRVSPEQKSWHLLERARGALVWVATQDFEPTVDGFMEHYRRSGLLMREGL